MKHPQAQAELITSQPSPRSGFECIIHRDTSSASQATPAQPLSLSRKYPCGFGVSSSFVVDKVKVVDTEPQNIHNIYSVIIRTKNTIKQEVHTKDKYGKYTVTVNI